MEQYRPPAPVSPYSNDVTPFQIIANSALQIFPTGRIAPGTLAVGNTDTRHYLNFTTNIYRYVQVCTWTSINTNAPCSRFTPTVMREEDIARRHGPNERISRANYVQVVEFYHRLMLNADTRVVQTVA